MTLENVRFNSETGDFEATISDIDKTYEITLLDFEEHESEDAKALAIDICNWLTSNLQVAKAFAASMLIDLKNSSWLNEDETPLSEKQFAATIQLDAITAFSDKSFDIYFNDNDLFWGHSIVVSLDSGFVLNDAEIAG